MEFNRRHLSSLQSLGHEPQTAVGAKLRRYAEGLLVDIEASQILRLSEQEVTRDYIFQITSDATVSAKTLCVAIFAWGGMRRDHARHCLEASDLWMPIVDGMRLNRLTRTAAYAGFHELRQKGILPGMGPAFFTKLVYFFLRNHERSRGYILDQWTARSANLLLSKNLIHLIRTKNGCWVSDKNSPQDYEIFCQFIEALGRELGVDSDTAEEMIFSSGNTGRKQTRGAWRAYVIEHG